MNVSIFIDPDNVNAVEYVIMAFDQGIEFSSILIIHNESYSGKTKRIVTERTGGLYKFKNLYKILIDHKIPCYFIKSINSKETIELLNFLNIDVLLLGGAEIINENVLEVPNVGILNCHPSDINKYRGCTNVEWAIYNDDRIFISCHLITGEVDHGPLIHQEEFQYKPGITYYELRTEIIFAQARAMINGVQKLLIGPCCEYEMPAKGRYMNVIKGVEFDKMIEKLSNSTYCPKIS